MQLCGICWLQPKLTVVQEEGPKLHQSSGHAKCLCLSQNRIKPTVFRKRQDAAALQGRGDVSVQPLPHQGFSTQTSGQQ